jgi:hypothetical protein
MAAVIAKTAAVKSYTNGKSHPIPGLVSETFELE